MRKERGERKSTIKKQSKLSIKNTVKRIRITLLSPEEFTEVRK